MIPVIEFFKKYKERVTLAGVVLAFLISIVVGTYLQKNTKRQRDLLPESSTVTMKPKAEQHNSGQAAKKSIGNQTSYFLHPSPEELLEKLASMENLNTEAIDAEFAQLPVLWPAYFFTLQQNEQGPASLLLDVSADGFGVVLECEVDLGQYPELKELRQGDKIWIGGKIQAVDPAGTGKVYLKTEQLSIGGEPPYFVHSKNTEQ